MVARRFWSRAQYLREEITGITKAKVHNSQIVHQILTQSNHKPSTQATPAHTLSHRHISGKPWLCFDLNSHFVLKRISVTEKQHFHLPSQSDTLWQISKLPHRSVKLYVQLLSNLCPSRHIHTELTLVTLWCCSLHQYPVSNNSADHRKGSSLVILLGKTSHFKQKPCH